MSLSSKITEFFRGNQENLKEFYPGINEKIFLRYFEDIIYITKNNPYTFSKLNSLFLEIKKGVPLEYVFKKAFFYELDFEINNSALIPRYETEILLEEALAFIKTNKAKSILDLGCGPGTILLNLMFKSPEADFFCGSDISQEALSLAKRNYFLKRFMFPKNQKVEFVLSDRFESIHQKFDLYVF